MKNSFLNRVHSSRIFSKISSSGILFPFFVFVALIISASTASANLHGNASLTYSNYNGHDNDDKKMSSSSLVQNYTLLYDTAGSVYNNRVGRYNVSLGYNWTALDTTFKAKSFDDDTYSLKRGHILYGGEIFIDPKEVPLKLNIYSRDTHSNQISLSQMNLTPSQPQLLGNKSIRPFSGVIETNYQPTNINDGTHIESGATLVAGVKNGMTNGYNEVLRHFPMILIDYKDIINKDLRSDNPVNDRLSRLAFVSLNKKENWFHFRHTVYEDYRPVVTENGKVIDNPGENNYIENEIQLGTVDQYMARRWIDFSNWIKVSTDIQFSKRKSNYQENPTENINLNLFIITERQKWNARTFTTFNRLKNENNNISYQTDIPLYIGGIVDRDTSWNVRTGYRNTLDINNETDGNKTTANFTDTFLGYRVDTLKHSTFNLSQSLDAEAIQSTMTDFLNLSGTIETASTSRFSRNFSLGASFNIKSMASSSLTGDSNHFEESLSMNGGYVPNNQLRFTINQQNTLTTGNNLQTSFGVRNVQTEINSAYNSRAQISSDPGNKTYHSLTTVSSTWTPIARLSIMSTVIEDIYKTSLLGISPVTEASSTVSFTNNKWTFSNSAKYMRGSREIVDDEQNDFSESVSVRYIHSRNIDGSASYSYSITEPSTGDSYSHSEFEQRLNYNYFTKSGMSRKLFDLNETLLYADGIAVDGRNLSKSLRLGFNYYPIRQLTLYAAAGYSITNLKKWDDDFTLVYNGGVSANFRLLQVSLDYSHGYRKIYSGTDYKYSAIENRFTGNVKKSF